MYITITIATFRFPPGHSIINFLLSTIIVCMCVSCSVNFFITTTRTYHSYMYTSHRTVTQHPILEVTLIYTLKCVSYQHMQNLDISYFLIPFSNNASEHNTGCRSALSFARKWLLFYVFPSANTLFFIFYQTGSRAGSRVLKSNNP